MQIVVLDGRTLNPGDNPWTLLKPLGNLEIYEQSSPEEALVRSRNADILITNKVSITKAMIDQLPQLKYITVTATGVNVVDLDSADQRKIPVSNVPEYSSRTVAQFVFAQILRFCHRVAEHDKAIRQGKWESCGDFSFWESPQIELVKKTMGIIGFGKIGQEVGKIAHAFGMEVLAATGRRRPNVSYVPFQYVDLDILLKKADFISLHCPLTDANKDMVNEAFLKKMKPSAYLINTARGGLVSEPELKTALNNDWMAGAALDVVSEEPIADASPLLDAKNCLLTPHMAWAALESRERLMQTTAENIAAFISGRPRNIVNGV